MPAGVSAGLDAFAGSLGVALERTTETYDCLVRAVLVAVLRRPRRARRRGGGSAGV